VRLYLDEDLASRELRTRLAAAGHDVVPPLLGESDAEVWAHAQRERAAVVTRNGPDFETLARRLPAHHGLLIVYLENDRRRDMTFAEIAAAIDRLAVDAGHGLDGRVVALNAFRSK
jgi:predicted nuclease of predicted toxin-antitoxin system